ncbi:ribose 5-phosphate isomerase [Mucilaginibacter rubeus]|uniref:hypothetical protein n=1 Tax=Mucilaginibacter rubeus TaxID=2027860 RepID=UPI00339A7579
MKLSKKDYLALWPGRQREVREQIYDMEHYIETDEFKLLPIKERAKIRIQVSQLNKQCEPTVTDYDNNVYDIDFETDQISYNEDGMRSDDEYNPNIWLGHE